MPGVEMSFAQHFGWLVLGALLVLMVKFLFRKSHKNDELNPTPLTKNFLEQINQAKQDGIRDAERDLTDFDAKYPSRLYGSQEKRS